MIMDQGEAMWEIQADPHLRIGPKWYTVATFMTQQAAEEYLDEHRDRLAREEGTGDFQVVLEED